MLLHRFFIILLSHPQLSARLSAAPCQLAPTYRRLLHDSQGPPSPDFGTASSTCGVFLITTCFFAHRNGDAVPIFPCHPARPTPRPPSAAAGIEISVCRTESKSSSRNAHHGPKAVQLAVISTCQAAPTRLLPW
ncbi:hypothetical protein HDK64DRAFT_271484 [Phyllosticta capitalensis]